MKLNSLLGKSMVALSFKFRSYLSAAHICFQLWSMWIRVQHTKSIHQQLTLLHRRILCRSHVIWTNTRQVGWRAILPHLEGRGPLSWPKKKAPLEWRKPLEITIKLNSHSFWQTKPALSCAREEERLSKDKGKNVKGSPNMRADAGLKTQALLLPAPGQRVRGGSSEERRDGWMEPVPAVSSTTVLQAALPKRKTSLVRWVDACWRNCGMSQIKL